MFAVNTYFDDQTPLTHQHAEPTLAKALRRAWELIGGIPGAFADIRRNGPGLVAYMECDWKGIMKEAEVYASSGYMGKVPCVMVTPLNPHGPLFSGVFAR